MTNLLFFTLTGLCANATALPRVSRANVADVRDHRLHCLQEGLRRQGHELVGS